MTVLIRRLLLLVAVAGIVSPAIVAGAATTEDLAARQALADARNAANETAAAFSASDHELEETQTNIAKLQESIAATKGKADTLHGIARQRAATTTRTSRSSWENRGRWRRARSSASPA
jgi:predicted  nucleic acid-binding Zn-ribbon protein